MRRRLVLLAALLSAAPVVPLAAQAVAVQGAVERVEGGFVARTGAGLVRVVALSPGVVRVTVGRDALPEDASWAVVDSARRQRARVTVEEGGGTAGFATAALRVSLDLASGTVSFADPTGRIISRDLAPPAFEGEGFEASRSIEPSEQIYGMGDKTGPMNRRGMGFINWNTDVGRFDQATDPLYKTIPFFLSRGGPAGAYGLFLDNTWRSWFDFGRMDQARLGFGANGGPLDYYFIAGPSVPEVVRRYASLTGSAPLPPLWALGYQQSRYGYMSADEIRQVGARLRQERIPSDVLWLDIDFQDRNRPFTTNPETFPDLAGLARDMRAQGFGLVTIIDLHVAHAPDQGYAPYDTGAAGDHFVHAPDGGFAIGDVWPGPSVFPDFTREASRRWWGDQYRGFVRDGIAGFWNDMNEPALFNVFSRTLPLDTVHRIEGSGFAPRSTTHAEIHNVMGMENTRGTFEGVLRLRPDARPFVMTRATYAGGQRYAVTWTGDNSSTWAHLKLAVSQMLNLGLSGFTYAATDVGGFTGGASPDLMTRWLQIQAFTPILRVHAAKDAPYTEPWQDGPGPLAIRRRFVEERYRLLPYLYGLAEQHERTGDPILRPVFYDYPEAGRVGRCDYSMSFTLGRDLLVSVSGEPESPRAYDVCLPSVGWYDYWSGLPVAGDKVTETPAIERLPVFVRPGAILPKQPLVQSTAETPEGPLELHVYPGPDCAGTLYADAGDGFGYRRSAHLRQALTCRMEADGSLSVAMGRREGSHRPWWRTIRMVVHGQDGARQVAAGRRRLESGYDPAAQAVSVELPDSARATTLTFRR